MKHNFGTAIVTLLSVAVLSVSLLLAGCNSGDKQDPDARIPDVPPSKRVTPGATGDAAPSVAKPPAN